MALYLVPEDEDFFCLANEPIFMSRKLRLLIVLLIFFAVAQAQVCIPDNDTVTGIKPDTLAPVLVGIPYEETIYFRLPADTIVDLVFGGDTIPDVPICIDSLTIDSVWGLPAGFSYGCHVPWCSVQGGANGCAKISGTATADQVGYYPIWVFVTIYVNDCFSFALPPQPDTVFKYFLNVQMPGSLEESRAVQVTGWVAPNPARGFCNLFLVGCDGGEVRVKVSDLLGRRRWMEVRQPSTRFAIEQLNLPMTEAGLFLVEVESEVLRHRQLLHWLGQ